VMLLAGYTSMSFGAENLPEDLKKQLLLKHNHERCIVKTNTMKILKWNCRLEAFAKIVADRCLFEHSTPEFVKKNKAIHGFDTVGENIAAHSENGYVKADLANGWANEKHDYSISTNGCKPRKMCGHYTQQVWAGTTDIGCAFAQCPSAELWKTLLFCEYGPAGNYIGQKPYVLDVNAKVPVCNETSFKGSEFKCEKAGAGSNVSSKTASIVFTSLVLCFIFI